MPFVSKRRYKKQYVVGGAGIFDTIARFFRKLVTSNGAKQIASTALSAGKDVATEIGKKAIDVGKSTAIDAGKRLVDKVAAKLVGLPPPRAVTKETRDILARLSNDGTEINNIMMGNGLKKAVSIQDLVRRLNGSGLKVA